MKTGLVLEENRLTINPHEKINPFITELTGITQKQADNGISLIEGFRCLRSSFVNRACYRSAFTWGINDLDVLKGQVMNQSPDTMWPFGSRSNDVQAIVFGMSLKESGEIVEMSLSESVSKSGLSFIGRPHDALDDAKNMYYLLWHLIKNKRGISSPSKKHFLK